MALVTFTNNQVPYLNAENLNNNFSYTVPVGGIVQYAGTTTPNGWLICDGNAVSRTTYADLFDIIGTTYGSGDGSSTFNLPNLKGRIPVGYDSTQTEFDTLGEMGGSKEMQRHSHAAAIDGGTGESYVAGSFMSGKSPLYYIPTSEAGTGNSGNLQPYIVLNYIIKY